MAYHEKEQYMVNSKLGMYTKVIMEILAMAALMVVLVFASNTLPILGVVIMLMWTLPVILAYVRHGFWAGRSIRYQT